MLPAVIVSTSPQKNIFVLGSLGKTNPNQQHCHKLEGAEGRYQGRHGVVCQGQGYVFVEEKTQNDIHNGGEGNGHSKGFREGEGMDGS